MIRSLIILAMVFQPLLAWRAIAGAPAERAVAVAVGGACCPLCDASGPDECACCCVDEPAAPDTPREPRAPAPERAGQALLAWLSRPTGEVVVFEPERRPARVVRGAGVCDHPVAGQSPQPFWCVWTT